jgi:CRISPR-associated protein Cas7/Cse4/CasC subtype I-E
MNPKPNGDAMRIEIHVLQNFAPSNLNRDDTGSPKDAEFGGYRRARISSQCGKRAVRWHKALREELEAVFAKRSTRHAKAVAELLHRDHGKQPNESENVGRYMFQRIGFKEDRRGRLTVLQLLGDDEIRSIANAAAQHWSTLAPLANAQLLWDRLADQLTKFLGQSTSNPEMFGRLIADAKAGTANAAKIQQWLALPRDAWEPLISAVRSIPTAVLADLAKHYETPPEPVDSEDEDGDEPNVPKKAVTLFKDKKKNKDVAEALGKIELPKSNDPKRSAGDADGKAAAKVLRDIFNPLQRLTTAAVDVALFGRMVAEIKTGAMNVDAACQVAHAISTNKLASMESDYFTAVDDLKMLAEAKGEPEDAGAGHLGTVEFNSACFYRYANLDVRELKKNLQGDVELARKTSAAFLKAFVDAIPTGKQNTFAAQNGVSLVFATVRTGDPVSLANAFVKPVAPTEKHSLVENSILAMDDYYGRSNKMHGDRGLVRSVVCQEERVKLEHLKDDVGSVEQLIAAAVAAAFPAGGVA